VLARTQSREGARDVEQDGAGRPFEGVEDRAVEMRMHEDRRRADQLGPDRQWCYLRKVVTFGLVVLALAATPPPVARAQAHLDSGALEEVLFDLDGKSFQGAEAAQASLVLARAARKSVEARDGVLGLQLAQMSLKQDANQPLALEAGANAALMTEQFELAERFADRWVAVDAGSEARLLRAQIAERQADWSVVMKTLEGVKGDAAERLRARAKGELDQKSRSMSELKKLEASIAAGQAKASEQSSKAQPRERSLAIIYSLPGCAPCEQVKGLLSQHQVPYFVKNIDDASARAELAQKQRKAGLQVEGSAPWTDLNGMLIRGFDRSALEKAIALEAHPAGPTERPRKSSSNQVVIYASEMDEQGQALKNAIGADRTIVLKNITEDPQAAQELERKKAEAGLSGKAGGKIWIDVNGKLTTADSFGEVPSAVSKALLGTDINTKD
jgi:glutaredoxin